MNDCLYVHDDSGVDGTNIQSNTVDPFVDRENQDFHIGINALLDACDEAVYSPALTDFDGEQRGFDDPIINIDGPYDIGADEDYPNDIIFKNGFE